MTESLEQSRAVVAAVDKAVLDVSLLGVDDAPDLRGAAEAVACCAVLMAYKLGGLESVRKILHAVEVGRVFITPPGAEGQA